MWVLVAVLVPLLFCGWSAAAGAAGAVTTADVATGGGGGGGGGASAPGALTALPLFRRPAAAANPAAHAALRVGADGFLYFANDDDEAVASSSDEADGAHVVAGENRRQTSSSSSSSSASSASSASSSPPPPPPPPELASVGLYGALNATASYLVEVGVAGKQLLLVADTGSAALAVAGPSCEVWKARMGPAYDPSPPCAGGAAGAYEPRPPATAPWATPPASPPPPPSAAAAAAAAAGAAAADAHPIDGVTGGTSVPLRCPGECLSPSGNEFCTQALSPPTWWPRHQSQCGFLLTYGGGAFFTGALWRDDVELAGRVARQFALGDVRGEGALFAADPTGAAGILGLAGPGLTASSGDSLIPTLARAGLLRGPRSTAAFGMCLSSDGGVLTLGGADPKHSLPGAETQWTPLLSDAYYNVHFGTVFINDKAGVPGLTPGVLRSFSTIVDSGTTLLLFPPLIAEMITEALVPYCQRALKSTGGDESLCLPDKRGVSILMGGACAELTEKQINAFPDFGISLSGISRPLKIKPKHYFLRAAAHGYCFGIGSSPSNAMAILGATFLQAFNVEFDVAASRVGFTPVGSCGGPRPEITSKSTATSAAEALPATNGQPMAAPLEVTVMYTGDVADDAASAASAAGTRPAGGFSVIWSSDLPVRFGDGKSGNVSIVDPINGTSSILVTPRMSGLITITATLPESGQTVTFVINAGLAGWEIAIVVVVSILVVAAAVVVSVVGRRWYQARQLSQTARQRVAAHLNDDPDAADDGLGGGGAGSSGGLVALDDEDDDDDDITARDGDGA